MGTIFGLGVGFVIRLINYGIPWLIIAIVVFLLLRFTFHWARRRYRSWLLWRWLKRGY